MAKQTETNVGADMPKAPAAPEQKVDGLDRGPKVSETGAYEPAIYKLPKTGHTRQDF